ncbi:SpoVR family protein (plasmid) [Pontibacillus sp. ALD_SL1]|uniref:SpoVR family protein n=1 Tax=Pontibacillus sp. ALD_SL1 TaxID=2777185 RepID=UPI001A97834A|nr:SpoVR family protein [Pontibacillus sp. ALD_SL1]QST02133.1 SpoVR family protein [Pontibacillus sp. ALD_SL1]
MLRKDIETITEIAEGFGLEPYDMVYERIPSSVMLSFASDGMPNRFSHWTFGKSYDRMRTQYDKGLMKIYELIINTDPSYVFLLEENKEIENKLIVAHVLAHSDFFKHNVHFKKTDKRMLQQLKQATELFSDYEEQYGKERVEDVIEVALSVQEHPDILTFYAENSPHLEEFERHLLEVIRDQYTYFLPQVKTKIINEGWATFWHAKIMRELSLSPEEIIDYSKLHSSVIAPQEGSINPYHIGYEVFKGIERTYGLEKVFEVRELHSDSSFIRNYLTEDVFERCHLYLYQQVGAKGKVTETSYKKVVSSLLESLVNEGNPSFSIRHDEEEGVIRIHQREGEANLDLQQAEGVIRGLKRLWDIPIELTAVVEGETVVRRYPHPQFPSGGRMNQNILRVMEINERKNSRASFKP